MLATRPTCLECATLLCHCECRRLLGKGNLENISFLPNVISIDNFIDKGAKELLRAAEENLPSRRERDDGRDGRTIICVISAYGAYETYIHEMH